MNKVKPLAIDLFAGAGGMSEGILQAGFHIIYSNEISKDAALTYQKRHEQLGLIDGQNTILEVKDIRTISGLDILKKISKLPLIDNKNIKIDAIFGGPPCQGFSRAGKQRENDTRNTLFREYLRIISEVKPKYVVFENVTGITDIKFSNYKSLFDQKVYDKAHALDIIVNELRKIGYDSLDYKILNASDFGVPQNRKRFILIAYKKRAKKPNYPLPTHVENKITTLEALGDLANINNINPFQLASKYGRTPHIITGKPIAEEKIYNNEKTSHHPYIKERFSLLNEGESIAMVRKKIIQSGLDLERYPHLLEYFLSKTTHSRTSAINIFKNKRFSENDLDILLTKKNSRNKLKKDSPSNTIVTLPDDIISPFDNRIFSVRELARLQSFDDSFIFYGKRTTGAKFRRIETPQYTQVGNAVPPLLAKAIAKEIINVLR
ncbi:DNA cytosine methyltransferase [Enterococcus mundtii]|uniref:Cytosine-specific methyltransferase n=1 Tax=Enterococcus mundtii TaxID=53346 RepID=A0AAI8R7K1_ENTMU|nr:DNA cytosine methyltransferase [Enterococcus mundtii]BBM13549.1 site-specific DNA-methyltransferase [Enterococcus mundtii]